MECQCPSWQDHPTPQAIEATMLDDETPAERIYKPSLSCPACFGMFP